MPRSILCFFFVQGNGGDGFVTVFEGSEKQHRVVKLQPSTQYRFRLQAVNDHGAR